MIMVSYNKRERVESKVDIMHNSAERWFAGLCRVVRSLVNKQVKG